MKKLAILFLVLFNLAVLYANPRIINVALYDDPPSMYMENGTPKGFYVDLLKEIATLHHWEIHYVEGTWDEGITRLRNGEVDLVTSVPYQEELSSFMDYSVENNITVWGQLYSSKEVKIKNLLEIKNKTVAIMKNDYCGTSFLNLCNQLNLPIKIIQLSSFDEVLTSVKNRKADVGVTSNIFGYSNESKYNVVRTMIIFNPFPLHFAVKKGTNADILLQLDSTIKAWKADNESYFYKTYNHWFVPLEERKVPFIPNWLFYILLISIIFIVVTTILTFFFKHKFAKTRKDLLQTNVELMINHKELLRSKEQTQLAYDYYLTLLEDLPTMIRKTDNNGNCDYFNRTWLRFTGNTLGKELEIGWLKGIHEEDIDQCKSLFESSFETHTFYQFEYRRLYNNGTYRWLVELGRPYYNLDNKFAGFVVTCYDITDQKNAEKAVMENDKKFRVYVENSPLAIFIFDHEGNFEFVNKAALEITGYSRGELLSLHYTEMIYSKNDENTKRAFTTLLSEGRLSIEFLLKRKNDIGIYASLDAVKISEDRFMGYCSDITTRKMTELNLRRLATVIEQSTENIAITDINGNIIYVNPSFEQCTGYKSRDILGNTFKKLKSNKTPSSTYEEIWASISTKNSWSGTFINKKADGTLYNEEKTIIPIRNENGEIVQYASIGRDVTHQNYLEEQIRQMQKMEAIGQLAGGVAHDLNNVLTPIIGYSDIIIMDEDNDFKYISEINDIKTSANRAKALVQQLLAFSRKQVLRFEVINLVKVMKEFEKMLKRLIKENIKITIIKDENTGNILADVTSMHQIILNLCVNAQDAMPNSGTITIRIENIEIDESVLQQHPDLQIGEYVQLSVSDTGIGMDKETISHIYEPFFTTKEVGKGTGLGLATVFGIVQQHKGYIIVYSELNVGSVFKIGFPKVNLAEVVDENKNADVAKGGSENIVICEDDEAICNIVSRALHSVGYNIVESGLPAKCLAYFKDNPGKAQLLVSDVVMPQMNGIDLYTEAKKYSNDLKVIFMSGYDEQLIKAPDITINYTFISKPFSIDSMLKTIRMELDK